MYADNNYIYNHSNLDKDDKMVFKVALSFVFKIFTFKQGSLLLLSVGISAFLTKYLSMLMDDTDTKLVIIPVVLQFVSFILFFLFTMMDLVTGIQASYHRKKIGCPVIKSYKLWRTLWKMLGIKLITFMLMLLAIFLEITDFEYGYWATTWFLTVVWLMANGFEFYSIGENLQNSDRKKPSIFVFWDKALEAIQRKAIKKIDNSFNILDNDKKQDS